MATFLRYQQHVVDEAGDVISSASVEIRHEETGLLATVYDDKTGSTGTLSNPLTADSDGYVYCYLRPGNYEITATSGAFSRTWEDVQLGNSGISDFVDDVTDLLGHEPKLDGFQTNVRGYHPDSDKGGDPFYWDSDLPRSNHNGGTIISPSCSWDGTQGDLSAFIDGTNETNGGANGCWVRIFSIGEIQGVPISWFGGVSDTGTTDNSAAIQATYDYASSSELDQVSWDGEYGYATTIDLPANVATFGTYSRQSGSDLPPSTMIWTGGATWMMEMSDTRNSFIGVAVENQGTATNWMVGNSSAQFLELDGFFAVETANHTQFSESVIKGNSNRFGYSRFKDVRCISPAPVFLSIDGQASPNAITPFHFKECLFRTNSTQFTVLKLEDETIEAVSFSSCHFIGQGGGNLITVDTTTNPATRTIESLTFDQGCEFETAGEAAGDRMLLATNVANINFNDNKVSGGGTMTAFADLVNSNVTSFQGNWWASINGHFWNADDDSFVWAGANTPDTSGVSSAFDNRLSGLIDITWNPTTHVLDFRYADAGKHVIQNLDVPAGDSFQFRVVNTSSFHCTPGQIFTVVVRNVSGGAIANTVFDTGFIAPGSPYTSPANGNQKSWTFYFDGTNAILINEGPEVANS